MISFKEYYLVMEMARPAKSFSDLEMNHAYAESLKKFKRMGLDNANTFTIWDFMYRLLPDFFKQPEFLQLKKKSTGTNLRNFVLNLINQYPNQVDLKQWGRDINDESKIRAYIDRPDKGNRHFGRVRADAQKFIDNRTLNP